MNFIVKNTINEINTTICAKFLDTKTKANIAQYCQFLEMSIVQSTGTYFKPQDA